MSWMQLSASGGGECATRLIGKKLRSPRDGSSSTDKATGCAGNAPRGPVEKVASADTGVAALRSDAMQHGFTPQHEAQATAWCRAGILQAAGAASNG